MDVDLWVRMLVALGLVLGLLGACVYMLRLLGPRLGLQGLSVIPKGEKPRLSITGQIVLDTRHRAVLLKRDGVEHLVILGGASPTVVEHTIPSSPRT